MATGHPLLPADAVPPVPVTRTGAVATMNTPALTAAAKQGLAELYNPVITALTLGAQARNEPFTAAEAQYRS